MPACRWDSRLGYYGFRKAKGGGQYAIRGVGFHGSNGFLHWLGGSHIGKPKVSQDEAIRVIRAALDDGLNFLDNSWYSNDGPSELHMGKALRDGYRQKAFLMTKFDGKSMGSSVILKSQTVTPAEGLRYALNLPTSVVITGIDSQKILDQAF